MTSNGFLGGLLIGLAVGAILAVLYAPEKGEKTRKKLAKRTGALQDRATDAFGTAGDIVGKSRKRMGI